MKKRSIGLMVAALCLFTACIGYTLAYLISLSNPVENVFTVGDVNISLSETTGNEYKMAPGVEIFKDPTVTVEANSETCWIFVRINKSPNFSRYCDFEIADGWAALSQNEGVYYQKVKKSAVNKSFNLLKNNRLFVKESLTEEDLNSVTDNPTLAFTAYAIQCEGMVSEQDAWREINH